MLGSLFGLPGLFLGCSTLFSGKFFFSCYYGVVVGRVRGEDMVILWRVVRVFICKKRIVISSLLWVVYGPYFSFYDSYRSLLTVALSARKAGKALSWVGT